MRRIPLLVAVAALATFSLAAVGGKTAAEEAPLRFQSLTVAVQPEYDTREVLVIQEGELLPAGKGPYAGYIRFAIPKGASIDMACQVADNGNHYCQLYELEDKGEYAELRWRPGEAIGDKPYRAYLKFYYNP
ncbi:MAG: hypothetical protein QJR13_08515, partial [Bacillota bacterium]|nr:hypothetical protein [Bacillota bacterium]